MIDGVGVQNRGLGVGDDFHTQPMPDPESIAVMADS